MASEEAVNWRVGLTLKQRLQYMMEGRYANDVTFRVGPNGERVRGHRVILISGSPVLENMLTATDECSEVVIDDVQPDVFIELLKYLYCEYADITRDNVVPLLIIAKKYEIPSLVALCVHFLRDDIDQNNVCSVLNHAIEVKEFDLTQSCLSFIALNPHDVLLSDNFLSLTHDALMSLVQYDRMNCQSEADVFNACLRWAKGQCEAERQPSTDVAIRNRLADVLQHIRFATLSGREFAEISCSSKLLTGVVRAEIYDVIMQREQLSEVNLTSNLNIKPRTKLSDAITINRFNDTACLWPCSKGAPDAVDFSCNKDVFVESVNLWGGLVKCYHEVRAQILDDDDLIIGDTGAVTIGTEMDLSDIPIPATFQRPPLIKASTKYTLLLTMEGHVTFKGILGQRKVCLDGLQVEFYDSAFSENGTNVETGQIAGLVCRVVT